MILHCPFCGKEITVQKATYGDIVPINIFEIECATCHKGVLIVGARE